MSQKIMTKTNYEFINVANNVLKSVATELRSGNKEYTSISRILKDLQRKDMLKAGYGKVFEAVGLEAGSITPADFFAAIPEQMHGQDKKGADYVGICWLEKDEFLKYSGNDEEYWNGKTLDEIEFLLGEIKAWCDKDVYGFVIEDAVRIQGIKTYYNGEREDEPYIDTQWEESDSCWDYYGGLDKVEGWIFEDYGLNKEELEEVA